MSSATSPALETSSVSSTSATATSAPSSGASAGAPLRTFSKAAYAPWISVSSVKSMIVSAGENTVNKSLAMLTSLVLSSVMMLLTAVIFAGPLMLLWNNGVTNVFYFRTVTFSDAFQIVLFMLIIQALYFYKFTDITKASF